MLPNLNSGLCYPPYAGTLILAYAGYAKSALYWPCSCFTMLVLNADENCIYGIPAEVAAPSKRGPSAFILAYLIETELNLPLREDLTCFL